MARNDRTARRELNRRLEDALDQANDIVNWITEQMAHADNDSLKIHWGHVGDATRTLEQLTEITDRMFGRGEYAD